jgi:hypothetical protein
MTKDAELLLTKVVMLALLFAATWFSFDGVHRPLAFIFLIVFLLANLIAVYRRKAHKQNPHR